MLSKVKCQPLFQISYPKVLKLSRCLQIPAEGPVPTSAGDFGCCLLAFSWLISQPSRWPFQPSFPAPSPFAPSQAPSLLVSTKACHNYLLFLEKTSRNGREWAKEGKDCKKSPQVMQICFQASDGNCCSVKQNRLLTTPCVSHACTLVHIIPLTGTYCCQNPTHQVYVGTLPEQFGSI